MRSLFGTALAVSILAFPAWAIVTSDLPGVEYLVADFDSGLAANNSLALTGFDSDLGFGADEVAFGPGDSGGPLFIGSVIAGVNAYASRLPVADVNGITDSSWGEGNFFTRVSYYRDFILAATNGTAIFIPEPSTLLLLTGVPSSSIFDRLKIVAEIAPVICYSEHPNTLRMPPRSSEA